MQREWLAVQGRVCSLSIATGLAVVGGWFFLSEGRGAEPLPTSPPISRHAETAFDQLPQHERQASRPQGGRPGTDALPSEERGSQSQVSYSSDRFLIGQGQGDLSKGRLVCQRVSELAARADLAKQIRVLIKEHAIDRVRERTGRETEQDIEVTREEIVQEYLQGVKIIDRQIDEAGGTCTATAVMPKTQIAPQSGPNAPDSPPPVAR